MATVTVSATSQVDPLALALGYKGWNFNPQVGSASLTPTSGTVYLVGMFLPLGTSVANIILSVQTASLGTIPTGVFFGLANAGGNMVAQTANVNAGSFASGARTYALGASYVTSTADGSTGLYYGVILVNGAWGTTQPLFLTGVQNGNAGAGADAGPMLFATGATTGQVALPANGQAIVGGLTLAGARPLFVGFT